MHNAVFFKFLRFGFFALFSLTMARWMLHRVALSPVLEGSPGFSSGAVSGEKLIEIYLKGFQFDLVILGFLFIPVALVNTVISFTEASSKWNQRLVSSLGFFLAFTWSFIAFVLWTDFPFFIANGFHRLGQDYSQAEFLREAWEWTTGTLTGSLITFVLIFFLVGGLKSILQVTHGIEDSVSDLETLSSEKSANSKWRNQIKLLSLLIPWLLVLLCCRGMKWGSHHLRREDSEITSQFRWNELALNPVWTLDKER